MWSNSLILLVISFQLLNCSVLVVADTGGDMQSEDDKQDYNQCAGPAGGWD